jgi:hypothetical protein
MGRRRTTKLLVKKLNVRRTFDADHYGQTMSVSHPVENPKRGTDRIGPVHETLF